MVQTSQLIAIFVPKLVVIATTVRQSILAVSSLDSLTLKTYP